MHWLRFAYELESILWLVGHVRADMILLSVAHMVLSGLHEIVAQGRDMVGARLWNTPIWGRGRFRASFCRSRAVIR